MKKQPKDKPRSGLLHGAGRGKPVTGKKKFEGIDTGEIKLPNGGKMRLVIGAITISVESE